MSENFCKEKQYTCWLIAWFWFTTSCCQGANYNIQNSGFEQTLWARTCLKSTIKTIELMNIAFLLNSVFLTDCEQVTGIYILGFAWKLHVSIIVTVCFEPYFFSETGDLHLTTYELSASRKVSLNFIKLTKKTNKKQKSQKSQPKTNFYWSEKWNNTWLLVSY